MKYMRIVIWSLVIHPAVSFFDFDTALRFEAEKSIWQFLPFNAWKCCLIISFILTNTALKFLPGEDFCHYVPGQAIFSNLFVVIPGLVSESLCWLILKMKPRLKDLVFQRYFSLNQSAVKFIWQQLISNKGLGKLLV